MSGRDLIGYGPTPPDARWPGGARIAVNFVVNYEEGAENSVLNGDAGSEAFLSEMVGAASHPARAMAMESLYEYGSRAGFWRLHRLFTQAAVPVTVFGVAAAMEMNPEAVEAMLAADWEIASHGYRWIDYQYVAEDVERAHVAKAIELHTRLTGSRPLGWYQGRTSPNTARIVAEEGGFVYDADSYADDVPYFAASGQLIVPYSLDANDMKMVALNGFTEGTQFFRYLVDTFEQLRAEGGRMMSVGLHGRIAGRPGRTIAVAQFLDHVLASGDAWVARRIDIARHWLAEHPPVNVNDPVLLAEVTAAFHAYERALMADDIPAMDALFHAAPTTNRYGVGEVLYGIDAIRAFRKGRGGSPQRTLGRVAITVYGEAFATADAEFHREGSDRRGRQTQAWVKFDDGWKIVSAHVSLEGTTS